MTPRHSKSNTADLLIRLNAHLEQIVRAATDDAFDAEVVRDIVSHVTTQRYHDDTSTLVEALATVLAETSARTPPLDCEAAMATEAVRRVRR